MSPLAEASFRGIEHRKLTLDAGKRQLIMFMPFRIDMPGFRELVMQATTMQAMGFL